MCGCLPTDEEKKLDNDDDDSDDSDDSDDDGIGYDDVVRWPCCDDGDDARE